MNFKITALLFGVLLSMLSLFGLMVASKKRDHQKDLVLYTMSERPAPKIYWVQIERPGQDKSDRFVFTLEGPDAWMLEQPPLSTRTRTEGYKIDNIVRQIKEARRFEGADLLQDLRRHGLDKPAMVITLKGKFEAGAADEPKDEKEPKKTKPRLPTYEPGPWTFNVGKTSSDGNLIYVNSSDFPKQVLAVKKGQIESLFFEKVDSLRPQKIFDFHDVSVQTIELKQTKDGKTSEVELKKFDDGSWRFQKPPLGFADFEGTPPPAPDPKKELPPVAPKGEGVKGLLNAISGMRVPSEDDFVALSSTEKNLAAFGLEEGKETLRIQITSGSGKKDAKKETLLIGQFNNKDLYFARLASDPGVFKISGKALEPIESVLKDPGALRSLDLASVDPRNVDAIDIRQGKDLKDKIEFRQRPGRPWLLTAGADKPGNANNQVVQELLESLQGKRAVQKFYDEEADPKKQDKALGFDEPAAEVTLYVEGLERPDEDKDKKKKEADPKLKKEVKPAVTLIFGKTEKDLVHVKRVSQDGTITRLAVAKSVLDKVQPAEGVLAFRETSLPVFSVADALRLEIARAKEKIEVKKNPEPKGALWLLENIKDLAGKNAADTSEVIRVLDTVARLQARKWVQKIGDKEDLDKFGLKDPAQIITVWVKQDRPAATASVVAFMAPTPLAGLNAAVSMAAHRSTDKGEPVVFKFGKEAPKGKDEKGAPGVYASRSGLDLLFLVEPHVAHLAKIADLRDHSWLDLVQPLAQATFLALTNEPFSALLAANPIVTRQVQRLDADKVKEIKLAVRTRVELRKFAFERKLPDKTWLDQSNLQDFNVDSQKVDQLVEYLAGLKADRFIILQGGAKAEHKFGDKEAHVKVDLVLADGKTITVTVGDRHEGYYFGQSTAWPGTVFLLPPEPINPLLQGADHFGKQRAAAN